MQNPLSKTVDFRSSDNGHNVKEFWDGIISWGVFQSIVYTISRNTFLTKFEKKVAEISAGGALRGVPAEISDTKKFRKYVGGVFLKVSAL